VVASRDCLEENEFLDLVTGAMPPDEAAIAEAHIDGCSRCRLVLAELARIFELRASKLPVHEEATEDPEESAPLPALLPPELMRGSQLGRYLVLEPLGAGAMGIVYAAYDPQLDRKVALKLLRSHKVDRTHSERLLREARAIAKLAHPNVVVAHDVGLHDDAVFIAMEFVDGGTLSQWQQDRDRDEVLRAYLDAARGLAAAHHAGLVHRDFKPANVLVGTDGRARVTDFGLARLGEPSKPVSITTLDPDIGSEQLTKTGAIVGTPAYMSPEQFDGGLADARSDQFSFCVALYEALSGERPFEGRSYAELELAVGKGEVTRHGTFHALPRPLRSALLRGLQVDPNDRFPDMEALIRALSPASKTSRWMPAILGGCVALGVGVFGFSVGSQQHDATPCDDDVDALAQLWSEPRREALRATLTASGVAYAEDVANEVDTRLDAYATEWEARFVPACAASATSSETACLRDRRRDLENLLAAFDRGGLDVVEFGVHAVQELAPPAACEAGSRLQVADPVPPAPVAGRAAAVRKALSMAQALMHTRQFDAALEATTQTLADAEELDYAPVLAEAQLLHGQILVDLHRIDDAEDVLMDAARRAWSSGHERVALEASTELVQVSGVYAKKPAAGQVWAELGQASLDRTGESALLEGALTEARGTLAHAEGDFVRAEAELREALRLRSATLAGDDLTLGYTYARLAVTLLERGELSEGLEHSRKALEIHRVALGPRHPSVARELAQVGAALMLLGQDDEAESLLRRSIEIRAPLERGVEGLVSDQAKLATLLTRQKKFDEARDLLEGSVERAREHDISPTVVSLLHHGLANNAFMAGRDEEALQGFAMAVQVLEDVENVENNLAHALVSHSVALLAVERCDQATPNLQRALEVLGGPAGTEYERNYAQLYYAYALLCDGKPREAADVARAAYEVAAADPDLMTRRESLAEVLSDALFELGERKASETAARKALGHATTPIDKAAASFRIARVSVDDDPAAAIAMAAAALPDAPTRDHEAIKAFLAAHGG
jgi:serine/threonine protein kinase/tetratricopeptide (TPR) repeat protein